MTQATEKETDKVIPGPLKPPYQSAPWEHPFPDYPILSTEDALEKLANKKWEDRTILRKTIKDLRPIIEHWVETNPDIKEFPQVLFDEVVVHSADLRGLKVPFALHFQGAYFLNGLDLGGCELNTLSISGHYLCGNLGLVSVKGWPNVSLSNIQIDAVYIYDSEISHVSADALYVADSITLAASEVRSHFTMRLNTQIKRILWLDRLKIRSLRVQDSNIEYLIRIRDVEFSNSIEFENSKLLCDLETESSNCKDLKIQRCECAGTLDFRNLDFRGLEVAGSRLTGRVLLKLEQLKKQEKTWFKRLVSSSWDSPSRLNSEQMNSSEALHIAAEELFVMRENFRRIPSMSPQEDFCAYRLMETHRKLQKNLFSKFLLYLDRILFGFMLLPSRVIRTVIATIAVFAAIYRFWPYGALVLNDTSPEKTRDILDVLYFSVITFTTVGYGDIHPAGSMRIFTMLEASLGVFLMAIFTLTVGRKLLRW